MHAETHHQIVAFGPDRMVLLDNSTGSAVVEANRTAGEWTVSTVGTDHDDVQVGPPTDAERPRMVVIQAMVDLTHKALGPNVDEQHPELDGYSCTIAPGLEYQP